MSALGPIGSIPFGWTGTSSGSGGSSGSTGGKWVTGTCGQAGGPAVGATSWTPAGAVLVGATAIDNITVNNANESSKGAAPQFTADNVAGSIDRAPNQFVANDVITVYYIPAS